MKSGIFYDNSDLLHYLSVVYIILVYGFHCLVRASALVLLHRGQDQCSESID